MFERLRYFIFRVLNNMRQTPVLSAATILTVAISLAIVAVFAVLAVNIQRLSEMWSAEVQVVAYLEQAPKADQLEEWRRQLVGLPEVETVDYVSPQQAYEKFRLQLGQEKDLLRGVTEDILPASLEISLSRQARNQGGAEAVARYLRDQFGFEDLHYGQAWLEKFTSFMFLLRLSGLVLGAILLGATLFIVFNTIRLTLFARKDELEIMALVGATPLFIKAPFVIEGAIQGAVGGVLALGGVRVLFELFLRESLQALLLSPGLFHVSFLSPPIQILLVLSGLSLGLVGSLGSLRKFVRV